MSQYETFLALALGSVAVGTATIALLRIATALEKIVRLLEGP